MASPLAIQMILCDAAVADPAGKVHMLGAGWSQTGSPTAPQAVVLLMKIPWDRANQKIPLKLQLLDADGNAVFVEGTNGPQALMSEGQVEVGRPPGMPHESLLDAAFVLNVPPMPLGLGRYEWRLEMAQQGLTASFDVRS